MIFPWRLILNRRTLIQADHEGRLKRNPSANGTLVSQRGTENSPIAAGPAIGWFVLAIDRV